MTGEFHKIFPFEQNRGVLIVTPEGDAAGYRESDLYRELNTLVSLMQQQPGTNLVIDLGASRYFGSIVIGAITRLAQAAARNGGTAAICNASDDMLQVLKVMKLDQLWSQYPTRKEALKALKT